MIKLLEAFSSNAVILSGVGVAVAFVWSICRYAIDRHSEHKSRQFEVYHRLVKELVTPDPSTGLQVDRQAAVVFELRHFPTYFEFTTRMLEFQKHYFSSTENLEKRTLEYLINEIDLTLNYIRNRRN